MRHATATRRTLYDPRYEHDSCGVGFVADINGAKSRRVLDTALQAVVNVTHRGAVSADAKTGDGAGVLTQIPSAIFTPEAARLGAAVANDGDLAVGVAFLPQDDPGPARRIIEEAARDRGLTPLGWRETPIDASIIGDAALATLPRIEHLLVTWPDAPDAAAFTRRLYLARKIAEREMEREGTGGYVASLSNRVIVYKGMLVAPQLQAFYRDLDNPDYATALAVLHQRYSTNTFPSWRLAHPFRMLGHNGEINTLDGNVNWMRARELASAVWGDDAKDLLPVIQGGGSDSSALDNALELLVVSGRDPLHAMAMLVPEAWENMPHMDPVLRAFYEYHACLTEPWDGPAALAFSDGVVAAAALDRNGLRPARYKITGDGLFVMASEVGAARLSDADVVEKGRIGPGQMIAVDTERKALLRNGDIKARLAAMRPYGEWLERRMVQLDGVRPDPGSVPQTEASVALQKAFAYTTEEAHLILRPLYLDGVEPVGSLGDDTPLSVLALKPRLLYSYFRQRFAQVTNPPIDPYREHLVMSLYTYLGPRGSLLEESEEHAALVRLDSPMLTDERLAALRSAGSPLRSETVSVLFPAAEGAAGLRRVIDEACATAERAVDAGCGVVILSDRGVDAERAAAPMLLAVGAVHHHLIRARKRLQVSLVAEVADARDMHQFALLIGYGASAINPYMAFETIRGLIEEGHDEDVGAEKAVATYLRTINKQLLKIMSKMGISTVTAYQGAQIFEAVGLDGEVVARCFAGTRSPVEGIGFDGIAAETLALHAAAFAPVENGKAAKLDDFGFYRYRRDAGAGQPPRDDHDDGYRPGRCLEVERR